MLSFLKGFFVMIMEIIIGAFWSLVLMALGVLVWLCIYGAIREFATR